MHRAKQILSCEFRTGSILKRVNDHLSMVHPASKIRFEKNRVIFLSSSQEKRAHSEWDVNDKVIDLVWHTESVDGGLEFEYDCSSLAESLKSIKKEEPVGFKLYDFGDGAFKLSMSVGILSMNREGSDSISLTRTLGAIEKKGEDGKEETPRCNVFIGAKQMERDLSRFRRSSLKVLMNKQSFVILGSSKVSQNPNKAAFLGELDDEDMAEVNRAINGTGELVESFVEFSGVNKILKSMCKIYDSPLILTSDDPREAISFEMFPSCFGSLKVTLSPK